MNANLITQLSEDLRLGRIKILQASLIFIQAGGTTAEWVALRKAGIFKTPEL